MPGGLIWLLLWAGQIGLALYVIFRVPDDPQLGPKVSLIRGTIIIIGFFPCGGLMLLAQAPGLLFIRHRKARLTAMHGSWEDQNPRGRV